SEEDFDAVGVDNNEESSHDQEFLYEVEKQQSSTEEIQSIASNPETNDEQQLNTTMDETPHVQSEEDFDAVGVDNNEESSHDQEFLYEVEKQQSSTEDIQSIASNPETNDEQQLNTTMDETAHVQSEEGFGAAAVDNNEESTHDQESTEVEVPHDSSSISAPQTVDKSKKKCSEIKTDDDFLNKVDTSTPEFTHPLAASSLITDENDLVHDGSSHHEMLELSRLPRLNDKVPSEPTTSNPELEIRRQSIGNDSQTENNSYEGRMHLSNSFAGTSTQPHFTSKDDDFHLASLQHYSPASTNTNNTLSSLTFVPPKTSTINEAKPTASISLPPAKRKEDWIAFSNHMTDVLQSSYYNVEIDHVKKAMEYNILIMGSPRIGKSTLINALTGITDPRELAETSAGLNACTSEAKRYQLKTNLPQDQQTKIFFWDTVGIEAWTQQEGKHAMFHFIRNIQPICVIFCAAPGCFANLAQVKETLDMCQKHDIFCAAVLTNMWSGNNNARKTAMADLEGLFVDSGRRQECKFAINDPREPYHSVTTFGNLALCTMVNSEPFESDFSGIFPVRGVDELIHCIMQSLSDDKLLGWCQAVLNNRSFWDKVRHRVGDINFGVRMTERKIVTSNVILCGAPRVGKSTLINAICQKYLAETSAGLGSCTQGIRGYKTISSEENTSSNIQHETIFWDTPGFESWEENFVRGTFTTLLDQTNPLCMIYCASPGSYADMVQVEWFVHECIKRTIFVALVCTNMWKDKKLRLALYREFLSLLEKTKLPNDVRREANDVIYFEKNYIIEVNTFLMS
ncbi:unnamed protein product, partial [Didymodactylos carnosus]